MLEHGAGRVSGIEVKASSTMRASDLNGLKVLREACGKRFGCGAVAFDGELTVGFGDGMFAVPIQRLWIEATIASQAKDQRKHRCLAALGAHMKAPPGVRAPRGCGLDPAARPRREVRHGSSLNFEIRPPGSARGPGCSLRTCDAARGRNLSLSRPKGRLFDTCFARTTSRCARETGAPDGSE